MKLSTAIRLGAMLKPQRYGPPFRGRLSLDETTCALAAACEAAGIDYLNVYEQAFMALWGRMHTVMVRCPECFDWADVLAIITHLNDRHRWTREQIADWVESVELAQDHPVAEQQVTA